MVARARRGVAAAVAVAAALSLVGCVQYDGEATGEIGDTLSFPTTLNSDVKMELTVVDFAQVPPADAEEWGIDAAGDDVYFLHYSGSGQPVRLADWVAITDSGESVPAQISFFTFLPDEAGCKGKPESGFPCAIFVVPGGETVESVRYNGVFTGSRGKGGYDNDQWVAWSVE